MKKEEVANITECAEEIMYMYSENRVFKTLTMLCELIKLGHRGASETYIKIGETLVGKKAFNEFYNKFFDDLKKRKG